MENFRTGVGVDAHKFSADASAGPCALAGLEWPETNRLEGHSDGDAAVHDAAAHLQARLLVNFRIEFPEVLASLRINGVDHTPIGDVVERVVPEQGCGFLIAAARAELVGPGKAQTADVRRIDRVQRAVALLAESSAVAQPQAGVRICRRAGQFQHVGVDDQRLGGLLGCNGRDERERGDPAGEQSGAVVQGSCPH